MPSELEHWERDVSNVRSFGLLAVVLCVSATTAGFAANQGARVPDFSSGDFPWVTKNGNYIPPPTGLGPLTIDKAQARTVIIPNNTGAAVQSQLRVADLNNPNLKPWVVEHLRKANAEELSGKLRYSARASCRPGGIPDFLVYAGAFQPIYILQMPEKIVMINQGNTEVRRIYMNVPHSANPKPSWYGESVGRYEGDELVVDTIGFNDKTFVDESFNLPHTTQLHVVERYRLLDEAKALQVTFTVEDPGAFNAPWSGVVRFQRTNAVDLLEEQPCADQQVGEVGFHSRLFDVPTATAPDF
jgi:hypothetical protein